MSGDSVAQDQLQSFVRRIESVEDEIKALNDDKSEIYKEARGNGFDVKILRKVVAARRMDAAERAEQGALFELYWDAIHGPVRAHVENIEKSGVDTADQSRDERRKQRFSESMDDSKDLSARAAALGLIDPAAHAETVRITDALASKFGNGPLPSHDPATGEILEATTNTEPSVITGEFEKSQVVNAPLGLPSVDDLRASSAEHEGDESSATIQPETANEVLAQDGGGTALDGRHSDHLADKPNAALPASVDANVNDGSHGVERGQEVVTGGESAATSWVSHSADDGVPRPEVECGAEPRPAAIPDVEQSAAAPAPAATNLHNLQSAPLPGQVWMEHHPTRPVPQHMFNACFTPHAGVNRSLLEAKIRADGVRNPIVKIGDEILDGWGRYNIARQLIGEGVLTEYPVTEYAGTDPLADMIRWNLEGGRMLTLAERKTIATKLSKLVPHRASEIAEMFGLEVGVAA